MVVKNLHNTQDVTKLKVEEKKIIRLLQNKDKAIIDYLYDNYSAALYGIILRIVNSEEMAQDVLQDVFIKIWKYGPRYDETKASLFTWMLNIARNTAIDVTRSSYFKKTSKNQEINSAVYNNESMSWERNVDQIGLKKLVENLDQKYREVIDLVYFQGFTQKEVQEHLNIPIGTVKTRVRIGLRELKKLFVCFLIILSSIN